MLCSTEDNLKLKTVDFLQQNFSLKRHKNNASQCVKAEKRASPSSQSMQELEMSAAMLINNPWLPCKSTNAL